MLTAVASGCGGTVDGGDTRVGSNGPGPGAGGFAGFGGDGGVTTAGTGGRPSRRDSGLSDARYQDPGCAPAVKVQGVRECDVFAGPGACGPGAKCTPYVQYAMDCQTEEIGTRCVAAGSGVQGDDCANDFCSAGFVCVSSGVGLQCAKLCHEGPVDDCPPGLLCGELDVDGFFVCG
jgi:hypothetical protein